MEAYEAARERGFEPLVLGGGANVLIADGVLERVVIATDRMGRVFRPEPGAEASDDDGRPAGDFDPVLPRVRHHDDDGETRLVAWAGAGLPGLVRTARDLGWSGLEGLVGVPGQLGGGVAMNAGGRWGELWDVIESVRLLLPDGSLVQRERADCEPRYRNGNLGGAFVLGAVLALERGNTIAIRETMRGYLSEKSAAQPVTERSCGCIFKNPDPELSGGRSAGRLVEEVGGKGLVEGDAIVSPKHANFIVNRGRATAADVLGLIERVTALVADRTGIELVREVRQWPPAEPTGA